MTVPLKAFPFAEDAPSCTPIGKHQPSPRPSFSNLDDGLPRAAIALNLPSTASDGVALSGYSQDLAGRTLDRELGGLLVRSARGGRGV